MPKDCVILVADLDTENAIEGLLGRPEAIGCRRFSFDLFRHPQRDPGVRLESGALLPSALSYEHALLILDRHGSGADLKPPDEIERDILSTLSVGWRERAVAIVIDPELEAWVRSDSPEVDNALGWKGRSPSLREWVVNSGFSRSATAKPADPKSAFEQALRQVGKARSASIFQRLGQTVSTRRCTDRAFAKLTETLRQWFPP
jgi:hypothetical protein